MLGVYVVSVLAAFSCFMLAIYVFSKNPGSPIHRSFFVMFTGGALWALLGATRSHLVTLGVLNTTFTRFTGLFAPWIFSGILAFWLAFPRPRPWFKPARETLIHLPSLVFGVLSVAGMWFANERIVAGRYYRDNLPTYRLFSFWAIAYLAVAFFIAVRKYRLTPTGMDKLRIGYAMAGTVASVVPGVAFALILPLFGILQWFPVGVLAILVLEVTFAYSIIRHRMLDVTIIVRKSLIYSVLLIAVLTIYAIVVLGLQEVFSRVPGLPNLLAVTLTGLLLIFGLRPLEDTISKVTDKFFFKSRYDYKTTLHELSGQVCSILNPEQLSAVMAGNLRKAMKVERVDLLLWDREKSELVRGTTGMRIGLHDRFMADTFLESPQPLVLEELILEAREKVSGARGERLKRLIDQFGAMESTLAMPILSKDKLLGILSIGRKLSGEAVLAEDVELLSTLAHQAALAIEHAALIAEEKAAAQRITVLEERVKYALVLEDKNKELETAYDSLKSAQRQLIQSEKMATIGTLAAGVAHELNTPLGAIALMTAVLLREPSDPRQKEHLELIKRGVGRCQTIIDQLLRYFHTSRVGNGLFDINTALTDLVVILENPFARDNITIERELEPLPEFYGNAVELAQVITNCLTNARDAILLRRGTGDLRGLIRIHTFRRDDSVVIEMADNGCGIAEDHASKIFDPFYTTKDIGKGTGLGLFVAQKIIESHQGQIEMQPAPGAGTVLTIRLPLEGQRAIGP